MVKQVYELDNRGYIKQIHVADIGETQFLIVDPPNGLFRPRWTGTEWVEDKTQDEFDEETMLGALTPTPQQIADAELEIKILNILMEVDLV